MNRVSGTDIRAGSSFTPLLFSRLCDHFINVIWCGNHVLLIETSVQRLFGREISAESAQRFLAAERLGERPLGEIR